MHPDDILEPMYLFRRFDYAHNLRRHPDMKPNTLNAFNSKSPSSAFEARKAKVNATGSGVDGGERKAKEVIVEGAGHLVAFERLEAV
jgi:hypothetical protein